MSTDKNVTTTY